MTELMSKKLAAINMNLVDVPEKPALNIFGIEETKDVLKIVCSITNALVNGAGLGTYLGALMDVPAAIDGIGDLKDEILDVTEDEIMALGEFVKENLDFDNDNLEEIVEDILINALGLVRAISKIV